MPEVPAPPPEAANDPNALLVWAVGILCAVVVFQYGMRELDKRRDAATRREQWEKLTELTERLATLVEQTNNTVEMFLKGRGGDA